MTDREIADSLSEAEVEVLVNRWHFAESEMKLHEYLEWSWPEYQAWASDQSAIPQRPPSHRIRTILQEERV